jgi:hypothetical protein
MTDVAAYREMVDTVLRQVDIVNRAGGQPARRL